MDDRGNTIAGWVLGAGIVALGASIVTGELYRPERPAKMGYTVEGVEEESAAGAAAAPAHPFEFYMAAGDPAKGAEVFKKCGACHNADKGGPAGVGPNLYGVVGEPVGQGAGGYPFSDALKGKGGAWDFGSLNQWLTSPKAYAPGTKMTFAGLSKPEDRADVIAYLNQQSAAPKPLPATPAPGTPADAAAAPAAQPDSGAAAAAGASGPAAKPNGVSVQTEAQAAKQPAGNIRGEGAPATSGTSATNRQ